jgi:ferredoxin
MKVFRPILRRCSTVRSPTPINIKIEYMGEVTPFSFPVDTMLGHNLRKTACPLDFECGCSCSCGTCAVKLTQRDFEKIREDQPPCDKERMTLLKTTEGGTIRLSCQLVVKDYFEGMVLTV